MRNPVLDISNSAIESCIRLDNVIVTIALILNDHQRVGPTPIVGIRIGSILPGLPSLRLAKVTS